MTRKQEKISLFGVRHHNLKNLNLEIPIGKLTVITGVSGSGKSTLAFDVLYAEGQRRYVETFSPYSRQFFDRMDKPQTEKILNILPAIAIEQRNSVKTSRSTVGTMTEICDYMKVIWAHLSIPYCPECGEKIEAVRAHDVWKYIRNEQCEGNRDFLICFPVRLSAKIPFKEAIHTLQSIGYHRAYIDGKVIRLDSIGDDEANIVDRIDIIQDRISLKDDDTGKIKRFADSCEQAYNHGQGFLFIVNLATSQKIPFTNKTCCKKCGTKLPSPSPGLFSYNHPIGACPVCHGFGRTIELDMDLIIPDKTKTLREGAIRPWQSGVSEESQNDLIKMAKKSGIPLDIPFQELTETQKKWVIDGDPLFKNAPGCGWPYAWYGVKGYFKWLEERTYKMHVRVFLARYRSYQKCTACNGTRLALPALSYKIEHNGKEITLPDFYDLEIRNALGVIKKISEKITSPSPIRYALEEVENRLTYLNEIGLGYLTLNRQTRQLSGGETERVNLTCCLGNRLVNTLYVLDEPTVGLHPRDTQRLIKIIKQLRDLGNTIVIVEHEALVMQNADYIIDLGPGAGTHGGEIMFQGDYKSFLKTKTLTADYLTGCEIVKKYTDSPAVENKDMLHIRNAKSNNIQSLDLDIPLHKLVCITGVSGSGKSTLLKNILYPGINQLLEEITTEKAQKRESIYSTVLQSNGENPVTAHISMGAETIRQIFLTDQSPIGKTPRSCPIMYIDAYDDLRKFFIRQAEKTAQNKNSAEITPGLLSYNSKTGQCQRCHGLGYEEIEMQFLSNIYSKCPDCNGTRFNAMALGITARFALSSTKIVHYNIADLLELTVDESIDILSQYLEYTKDATPNKTPAVKTLEKLKILQDTGLGYIKLGQPLNTLSGGECQRLKLAAHITETMKGNTSLSTKRFLPDNLCFLFDEPTTGLHFQDVQVLLNLLSKLVAQGHSVILVEHNLDIIRNADWIIDMGPEAGSEGGKVVISGTPTEISQNCQSHTGAFLRQINTPQKHKRVPCAKQK